MRGLRERASVQAALPNIDFLQRDPADNPAFEAAVARETDYIVTGDQDLLVLVEYQGIRIVTPAMFLALLRTEAP